MDFFIVSLFCIRLNTKQKDVYTIYINNIYMMKSALPSTEIEYQNPNIEKLVDDNEHDQKIETFCDLKENMESIAEMENKMSNSKKNIPFWSENPNILFQQKYVFEFYPVDGMSYAQKLNAITRTVILLVLIFFLYSNNFRMLIIGIITFMAIYVLYFFHMKEKEKRESKRGKENSNEGFANPAVDYMKENEMPIPTDVFDTPDSSNPFSNVLVTDIDYNPHKKPAPPAYNKIVGDNILTQAKKLVSDANPDHPDIADKLFGDMGSNMEFEQSLRPFTSTPNTMLPNDQGAFAEFCYGSMISCKEGNDFACARNLARHIN
jgi:hypothetical protein